MPGGGNLELPHQGLFPGKMDESWPNPFLQGLGGPLWDPPHPALEFISLETGRKGLWEDAREDTQPLSPAGESPAPQGAEHWGDSAAFTPKSAGEGGIGAAGTPQEQKGGSPPPSLKRRGRAAPCRIVPRAGDLRSRERQVRKWPERWGWGGRGWRDEGCSLPGMDRQEDGQGEETPVRVMVNWGGRGLE